jgi:hypothetical protein
LWELYVELLEETLMVNQDKYGSDDRIDTLTAADSSNGLALSMAATDSLNGSQASTMRQSLEVLRVESISVDGDDDTTQVHASNSQDSLLYGSPSYMLSPVAAPLPSHNKARASSNHIRSRKI